jgi:hypothetical protein
VRRLAATTFVLEGFVSNRLRVIALGVMLSLVGSVAPSAAASITFSGADLGGGVGGATTNSDAAHDSWLAAVGTVSATEDFEAIALGSSTPISLAGGMTLSTVGGPIDGGFDLNEVTNNQDPQIGYNTTSGGANYFRFSPDFGGAATMTIAFSSPVTAFGVYITGIQNGFGITTASWGADSFQLLDTQGAPGFAGVQFFGFISDAPIGSVSFLTTPITGVRDVMGFDDIELAGSPVPEPATVGLLLAGLLGIGVVARRRKA